MISKKIIFNILGFYLCWWITVFGVKNSIFYIGPVSVVFFILVHLYKVMYDKKEIIFLFICFILGGIIDTILLRFSIVDYKGVLVDMYRLAPLWVMLLWLCFGATVYHSFRWAKRKYMSMFFIGAISGPLVYFSASKLGVVVFNTNLLLVLVPISIIWSIFIPFLIFISDQIMK